MYIYNPELNPYYHQKVNGFQFFFIFTESCKRKKNNTQGRSLVSLFIRLANQDMGTDELSGHVQISPILYKLIFLCSSGNFNHQWNYLITTTIEILWACKALSCIPLTPGNPNLFSSVWLYHFKVGYKSRIMQFITLPFFLGYVDGSYYNSLEKN